MNRSVLIDQDVSLSDQRKSIELCMLAVPSLENLRFYGLVRVWIVTSSIAHKKDQAKLKIDEELVLTRINSRDCLSDVFLEKMVRPKFPTIVQFQVFHGTLQFVVLVIERLCIQMMGEKVPYFRKG